MIDAMRTTVTLDDELIATAMELTGVTERSALLRSALEALIARENAQLLIKLGGTDPEASVAPRRRGAA